MTEANQFETGATGGITRDACPRDETLIAYLTAALSPRERAAVDLHLRDCDPCVELLPVMQRRIRLGSAPPFPLPQGLRADAPQALAAGAGRRARLAAQLTGWLRSWRWSYPALVPAAVAVAALLVVAQRSWMAPTPPRERSRAVETHDVLPVTAPSAEIYPRPSSGQPAIVVVQRGARIEIVGEEEDWYHVRLTDGREGWMERRAFE